MLCLRSCLAVTNMYHYENFVIIIIRINDDYSFDDDISLTYGCETHSFDPRYGVSTNYSEHTI